MLLRIGMTEIPIWELAATLSLLAFSVALTVYLSVKIFEGSILQFDTASSLKDITAILRGRR